MSEELNRQAILDGHITRLARSKPGSMRLMPDDERADHIARTLAEAPSLDEVWVYAYGSLIWNPALHYADTVKCMVAGFHRSFCFWTVLGRGSAENPGLMLGLEPGGTSNGLAYRIDATNLDTEMDILFRREMMSYVYQPTWVDAQVADNSGRRVKVLAFVVDPAHERFCGGLDMATMVRHIATAEGSFGRNCEYLFQLVENLHQLGFEDPAMAELQDNVRRYLSGPAGTPD